MCLDPRIVDDLASLWQEESGERLSADEAQEMSWRLITLYRALFGEDLLPDYDGADQFLDAKQT